MLPVTKPFLPPQEEYTTYLQHIWESSCLTNHGPLAAALEDQLQKYLGIKHAIFVASGTLALQVSIKALELSGEIISTPFSFVATTTAILWEHCTPVFVDIEPQTFCIDVAQLEKAITSKTSAILVTHIFGYPCQVEQIQLLASRYNLKVIYDGAHAFGVAMGTTSIFTYGDISITSFHATKLFHTIEGGAIFTNDDAIADKCRLLRNFGYSAERHYLPGINAKNSEFHAAMGLCLLPRVNQFIEQRKQLAALYRKLLKELPVYIPSPSTHIQANYAYFPVVFTNEQTLLLVREKLAAHHIQTSRYFFPSLNKLAYCKGEECPVAEDISQRILCLPYFQELREDEIEKVASIIKTSCMETIEIL
jgi:dTDP-4-amino-4,6-dideoxygalactose transaminase